MRDWWSCIRDREYLVRETVAPVAHQGALRQHPSALRRCRGSRRISASASQYPLALLEYISSLYSSLSIWFFRAVIKCIFCFTTDRRYEG